MPIYEYGCHDCNKVFEEIQKFSDEPLTKCLLCQGKNIEKLISSCTFQLKGGGWAVDGYDKNNSFDITGQGKV